jgi:hypothetical protein
MNSLASGLAIITDTSENEPMIGSYYKSFPTMKEALDDPDIYHIVVHKTQDEEIPSGITIDRSIHITCIGPSLLLKISDLTINSKVTIRGLTLKCDNINIMADTIFEGCNIDVGSIESYDEVGEPSIIFKGCKITMQTKMRPVRSNVFIHCCDITTDDDGLAEVYQGQFISANNTYYIDDKTINWISPAPDGIPCIVSVSGDVINTGPGSGDITIFPITGMDEQFCQSRITVLGNNNISTTDQVDTVSRAKRYRNSCWYAYHITSLPDTLNVTIPEVGRTFIVSPTTEDITISGLDEGRELLLIFKHGNARKLRTDNQVIDIPDGSYSLKMVISDYLLHVLV